MIQRQTNGGPRRGWGRTRALVLARYLKGQEPNKIAKGLGVSRQAVHQHLVKLRQDGEIE